MKLNIGAGDTVIEGFTAIDRKLGTEAYPLRDVGDSSVDEIRASHILEHFGFKDVQKVLTEWVRVLEPGGLIRIAVPDFNKIKQQDDKEWSRNLMGGQKDDDDFHRSVFTEASLTDLMRVCGLIDIRSFASDNTDTASHSCSLNLEAVKRSNPMPSAVPLDAEVVTVKADDGETDDENSILIDATCIMSIPRVGFNDHWGCITDVFGVLGIPIIRFTGAFWGHGMQAMMMQSRDAGAEWIISVDYDSMFSLSHMNAMLSMMGRHPEIDALTCVQSRRVHNNAMLTRSVDGVKQQVAEIIDGQPIQCDTAHFGLTIFRASGLVDLPLPWFNAVPGPDGTWEHDDHIDDDVYFWKNWQKHGRTLFVHPNVRIGHLELVVAGFDEEFNHRYQTVQDWREEHSE